MIVVDTNILAYLFLPGEFRESAGNLLLEDSEWAAPVLWKSEFRNILVGYVRKGLLSSAQSRRVQKMAEELLHENEFLVPSNDVLELAENSTCRAYDCEFVAVAKSLGVRLVTMNKQILREFPKVASPLLA
ncbi:type II toxin-antitoxin system VapC family toxin [Propionimicrobium lymphophilum]|uniref:type II toxin-antitoxin system VapC family toxin n=1 Tax=Propionimicrobium lymphophilum TaxID=33012 RepID=UPI00288C1A42|nr:type II toxin-antitoxin system VapC family toxin [Propionimicrobium lymphophilum]